ncbi:YdjY domain-containing protein [Rubritalea tangerina]|uniref:YdjY domain-containing protein n=1 Tax=Rubritalea tangerina TaxID=430798 RepID=UPI00366C1EBE
MVYILLFLLSTLLASEEILAEESSSRDRNLSENKEQSEGISNNRLSGGMLTNSGKYSAQYAQINEVGAKVEASPQPKVEVLGEGRLRIGEVHLDKHKRTIMFPAKVNMVDGVVEYLLVSEQGKVHESVFTTVACPRDVHVACLLLGVQGVSAELWPDGFLSIAPENQVRIEVSWKSNGPIKKLPISKSVVRACSPDKSKEAKVCLADGAWLYSGSYLRKGAFAAQVEGSVIAIIADRAALVNGLRPNNDDDSLFTVNRHSLPRRYYPVRITLTMPSSQ